MQKPLAVGQRKTVPGVVMLAAAVRCVPCGLPRTRGKIPQADGGRRAAPDPGLRRWHSGVGAGFEPEGGHLVLIVADVQHEMVQGAAKDGIGAIVEQLKRRCVAVPPHEHRRCVGRSSGSFGGGQRQCCV